MASQRDETTLRQIRYWDSGPASYRWIEQLANRFERPNTGAAAVVVNPLRVWTYLTVAMYDATIACWDAKYKYNRPRPSQVDATLTTAIANPATPSYPSEHAVVAGAASAILAYFYPDEAADLPGVAEEAARSRLTAGVDYPSDYFAGLDLGRAVAARVIDRAKSDGALVPWTGTIPQGPGFWNGANPVSPTAPDWKTWVLSSAREFRPGPPPDYNSAQKLAELNEVKNVQRTFEVSWRAFLAQTNEGIYTNWFKWASRKTVEYKIDTDQPRAARTYALLGVAMYDSLTASFDGKYSYWAIRPFQLDKDVTTLFATPNHPSYPANHGSLSGAMSEVLAYLFPADAQEIRDHAIEDAESRVWAGIHFRSDIVAGLDLSRKVGGKVGDYAAHDGSGL
jgi:membrane-associated phospholipid phosphatase